MCRDVKDCSTPIETPTSSVSQITFMDWFTLLTIPTPNVEYFHVFKISMCLCVDINTQTHTHTYINIFMLHYE